MSDNLKNDQAYKTIGDIEEFFPVSGTLENRVGRSPFNHHDDFRKFDSEVIQIMNNI